MVWVQAWWIVRLKWFRVATEIKKWEDLGVTLEVEWVWKRTVEGFNLAAHRGLKRWLFWERKLAVCACSTICSYLSSTFSCCATMWVIGLCGYLWLVEMCSVCSYKFVILKIMDGYFVMYVICGEVGVVFLVSCELSLIWGSKKFLLIEVWNIPKKPAKSMRAALASLFSCVCVLRKYCKFLSIMKREVQKGKHCM